MEHLLNPKTAELQEAAHSCEAVFINVYVTPLTTMGTARVALDSFVTWGWRSLFTEHRHVFYTSFGSPYLLYELPTSPNLIATYGGCRSITKSGSEGLAWRDGGARSAARDIAANSGSERLRHKSCVSIFAGNYSVDSHSPRTILSDQHFWRVTVA